MCMVTVHAGSPLDLIEPESLRWKVMEPILILGKNRFANVDIRIRVKGGGTVAQIYGGLLRDFAKLLCDVLRMLLLRKFCYYKFCGTILACFAWSFDLWVVVGLALSASVAGR